MPTLTLRHPNTPPYLTHSNTPIHTPYPQPLIHSSYIYLPHLPFKSKQSLIPFPFQHITYNIILPHTHYHPTPPHINTLYIQNILTLQLQILFYTSYLQSLIHFPFKYLKHNIILIHTHDHPTQPHIHTSPTKHTEFTNTNTILYIILTKIMYSFQIKTNIHPFSRSMKHMNRFCLSLSDFNLSILIRRSSLCCVITVFNILTASCVDRFGRNPNCASSSISSCSTMAVKRIVIKRVISFARTLFTVIGLELHIIIYQN